MRSGPRFGILPVVLAFGLAAATAGCGSTDDGSAPAQKVDRAALEGRTFVSTRVTGHELVAGTKVRISFESDSLSASAGCNTMIGRYELKDGRLRVAGPASTMMGCDPKLMKQDEWLSGLLAGGPQVTLAGDLLTLTGDGSTLRMAPEKSGRISLAGPVWRLETTTTGDGTATSVPGGKNRATLKITGTGLTVDSGCNTGTGTVEIGEDSINVKSVAWTEMSCSDPAVMRTERILQRVLNGRVAVSFDGSDLVLRRGGTGLVFRTG